MEDNKPVIGDLVFNKKRGLHVRPAILLAVKKANNDVFSHLRDYQDVYYILMHDGQVEGPLFRTELLKVS
jgi:hypothetical protein